MGLMYTIFVLIATVFTGAWAYFRIKEGKVDQDDYDDYDSVEKYEERLADMREKDRIKYGMD